MIHSRTAIHWDSQLFPIASNLTVTGREGVHAILTEDSLHSFIQDNRITFETEPCTVAVMLEKPDPKDIEALFTYLDGTYGPVDVEIHAVKTGSKKQWSKLLPGWTDIKTPKSISGQWLRTTFPHVFKDNYPWMRIIARQPVKAVLDILPALANNPGDLTDRDIENMCQSAMVGIPYLPWDYTDDLMIGNVDGVLKRYKNDSSQPYGLYSYVTQYVFSLYILEGRIKSGNPSHGVNKKRAYFLKKQLARLPKGAVDDMFSVVKIWAPLITVEVPEDDQRGMIESFLVDIANCCGKGW